MTELPNTPESVPAAEYNQLDAGQVQDLIIEKRLNQFSRKKKLVGIIGMAILATAIGTGVYIWQGGNGQTDYLTAAVTRTTITDYIEATGALEPVMKSEMGFKNDGEIILLNVQPGDKVAKGQVLAKQESAILESALEQALSSVVQDEIGLETAKMNLDSSREILEQQEMLFEAGVSSEAELKTARNNLKKSEMEVKTAEARLANDRSKVEQARSNLSEVTLIAPFDGIIGAVNGQVGQINGINASSSTLLTVMSRELQINALVNEADIGRIRVGQEVEFTCNTYADKVFKGQVLRITPEAESISNVQYYPVLISSTDPDGLLYSGMSVSAKIIITREENVLTVPMMAVSYAETYARKNPGSAKDQGASDRANRSSYKNAQPNETSTGSSSTGQPDRIMVLQNDKPIMKTVLLGLSNGSVYQVVSGLNEGDKVIIGSNQVGSAFSSSKGNPGNSNNSGSGQPNPRGGGMPGPGVPIRVERG